MGRRVFCSDVTFDASVNPVAYEDGEAIFIDTEYDTWNMSPEALERAFEIYPDVKFIILMHLYGTSGKMEEIRRIADEHNVLIMEDAAESLGAKYKLRDKRGEIRSLGDYNAISFRGSRAESGEQPLRDHSPGSGARYARRRRECRGPLPGILAPGEFVSA